MTKSKRKGTNISIYSMNKSGVCSMPPNDFSTFEIMKVDDLTAFLKGKQKEIGKPIYILSVVAKADMSESD